MSTYQTQLSFEYSINRFLGAGVTFFDICNGDRPGGHFLQKEAWEAYTASRESTRRAILRTIDDEEDWR